MCFKSTLLLLVVVFFSGVMSNDEEAIRMELFKCIRSVEIDREHLLSYPDGDSLKAICPQVIGAFDCFRGVVEDYAGYTLEMLIDVAGVEHAQLVPVFLNVENLLRDLCNEDSQIHKDYIESETCFDTALSPITIENCGRGARTAYNTYKEFEDSVQEEADENAARDNRECMHAAYVVACGGASVKQECGQKAFDTYVEIFKRSTLLKNGLCSVDDLETAKTQLIDRLEMESAHKDLYRLALNLMKRRK